MIFSFLFKISKNFPMFSAKKWYIEMRGNCSWNCWEWETLIFVENIFPLMIPVRTTYNIQLHLHQQLKPTIYTSTIVYMNDFLCLYFELNWMKKKYTGGCKMWLYTTHNRFVHITNNINTGDKNYIQKHELNIYLYTYLCSIIIIKRRHAPNMINTCTTCF